MEKALEVLKCCYDKNTKIILKQKDRKKTLYRAKWLNISYKYRRSFEKCYTVFLFPYEMQSLLVMSKRKKKRV